MAIRPKFIDWMLLFFWVGFQLYEKVKRHIKHWKYENTNFKKKSLVEFKPTASKRFYILGLQIGFKGKL